MADTDQIGARLTFLRESARIMALTSPTTAAFLGAQHDKIMLETDQDVSEAQTQRDARRREICGRCGNFMIPGWSCTVRQGRFHPRAKVPKRNREPKPVAQRCTTYKCSRCAAYTRQAIPQLQDMSKLPERIPAQMNKAPSNLDVASGENVAASANSSSKKRAKARKKGGLQALLSSQKPGSSGNDPSGFGLDLMDLMKSA